MLPKCLDCGAEYGDYPFLWVSDETWKKMGCNPRDYLCPHCLINRLGKLHAAAYIAVREGIEEICTAAACTMSVKQNRDAGLIEARKKFYGS